MKKMPQHFPEINRPNRTAMFSETAGNLLKFLLETLFLYTVPFVILGKVSSTQKEIVPKMLMESCSSKNALYIAKRIVAGYTNFDKPLTQLYLIWISLLRLISKKLILGY